MGGVVRAYTVGEHIDLAKIHAYILALCQWDSDLVAGEHLFKVSGELAHSKHLAPRGYQL